MSMIVSQITYGSIVCWTVCSGADQRKLQSSLAFVRAIYWWPMNSPHKGPVTWKKMSIWWHHHAGGLQQAGYASYCCCEISCDICQNTTTKIGNVTYAVHVGLSFFVHILEKMIQNIIIPFFSIFHFPVSNYQHKRVYIIVSGFWWV